MEFFSLFRLTVKQGNAFRAKHPFMGIGHDKIRVNGLDIKSLCAKTLNGIHTKQDVLLLAKLTQFSQVCFKTGAVLHRADCEYPGLIIAGSNQCIFCSVICNIDFPEFNSMVFLCLPDNTVGRKFLVGTDDILTMMPFDTASDH